jgi:hypothetical protein
LIKMESGENQDDGEFLRLTYSREEESGATQANRVEQSVRIPFGLVVGHEGIDQAWLGFAQQRNQKHSELAITAHHRGDECMKEEEETKTGQPSPDRRGDSPVDENEPLTSSSAWGHWFATSAMSQDRKQSSEELDETSSFFNL